MSDWHTLSTTVDPSRCDSAGLLAIDHAFAMFMDIAGRHAEVLGVGMVPMLAKGLFWLTVRTKVRFLRRPAMLEAVALSTRPIAPSGTRCVREYRMEAGGEPLILGKTEWAVMDVRMGGLVPIADVFPEGTQMAPAPDFDAPFVRVTGSLARAELLGEYTVRSTDIDLGGHMNNAAYLRAALGLFSVARLKEMDPKEAEVVFLAPCFEGETLAFRVRERDGGTDFATFRPDGKLALLGRLA